MQTIREIVRFHADHLLSYTEPTVREIANAVMAANPELNPLDVYGLASEYMTELMNRTSTLDELMKRWKDEKHNRVPL